MKSRTLASLTAVVLFTTLAIPVLPATQDNQNRDHHSIGVTFAPGQAGSLKVASYDGAVGTAACAVGGRPCGGTVRCCPGLVCRFRGGSTRVGYQCVLKSSTSASSNAFWEQLNPSKLD